MFNIVNQSLYEVFDPENMHATSDKEQVSISLYKYWREFNGPEGLTRLLKTSPKNGIIGTE
jgi:hypothetical protein